MIYYKFLTETAYIQKGTYEFAEKYNEQAANSFYYNAATGTDVAIPDTFSKEWATVTNTDYDWGAYGIGLQRSASTVTLPSVVKRSLLYMYDIRGTSEERHLLESTLTKAELTTAGILGALYSEEEFYEQFGHAGRVDFGGMSLDPVLPSGLSETSVSELYSYNAVIDGVNSGNPVQVYVSPTWLGNERPLFDEVYLLTDRVVDATDSPYVVNDYQGISKRRVRWLGGVPSENIAAINREGGSLDYANNSYKHTDTIVDEGITENGETYSNTDAYNVTNLKRF